MKEIKKSDIMPLSFLKKERFTGSSEGMRYRMEMHVYELEEAESEGAASIQDNNAETTEKKQITELLITVWKEPYAYDYTAKEDREEQSFPFTEEGLEDAVLYLNEAKVRYL